MNLPSEIRRYIKAYNAMDVAGMLDCLSEDVVFRNYSGDTLTAEAGNKTEFAELAEFGVKAFRSRTQTVTHVISVADTTAVEISYDAVVALDLPNGWKTGQELRISGASLFQVSGGRITAITDQS